MVSIKSKNWLSRRNVCRCNSQGSATGGADEQADDISGDADDPTSGGRRRRPPGRLLSHVRGNGGTGWRSKSRRHVRRALSGRRKHPEVLRVFLQARRPRQTVQVRRPEVQQLLQMRAKVLVHVRYRRESWIEGMVTKCQDSVVIPPSRVEFFKKKIKYQYFLSSLVYLSRWIYLEKLYITLEYF